MHNISHKPRLHSFLSMSKDLLKHSHVHSPIHLSIIYSCFCAPVAQKSSSDSNYRVHKV